MKKISKKQKQVLLDNHITLSKDALIIAKKYGDIDRFTSNELVIFSLSFFFFFSFVLIKIVLSEDKKDYQFYLAMCIAAFIFLVFTIVKRIVYLKKHYYNILIILDNKELIIIQEEGPLKVELTSLSSCQYELNLLTNPKKSRYMKYGSLTLKSNHEEIITIENVGQVKMVFQELSQMIKQEKN